MNYANPVYICVQAETKKDFLKLASELEKSTAGLKATQDNVLNILMLNARDRIKRNTLKIPLMEKKYRFNPRDITRRVPSP